uniref:patatin-like phospholipase family protein n=1 Tax=uncultured Erythrobacter sp. TaxID=263913 RepID=UPI00260BC7B3|nr:patatin-like phospholipase family protein [uncultured Erythrobacter sp.]
MRIVSSFALFCLPFLSGCSVNPLNLSSLPISSSIEIRNEQTHSWLATAGPMPVASMGLKGRVRDAFADGEVVGMTVSGGGMRASAFTLGILEELEEIQTPNRGEDSKIAANALERVDFISSISGGSWTIAAFLANRFDDPGGTLKSKHDAIIKAFAKTKAFKVRCFANGLVNEVTNRKTFGEIYSGKNAANLPQVFFGSSLYPSQSPFVFTQSYLQHYRIRKLGDNCAPDRVTITDHALENVQIGYAASASGTVPSFTSAFGITDLCDDRQFSFCNRKKAKKSANYVQIVDGGVYDNLGYKTAFEHLLTLRDASNGTLPPATMIMIDAGTDEPLQSVRRSKRNASNTVGYAFASSFPNQDATYTRLAGLQFRALGVSKGNTVLLDFDSVAGFDPAEFPNALDDLPELADYAARGVRCLANDPKKGSAPNKLKAPKEMPLVETSLALLKSRGPDCVRMNFARAGYLHKTSYKYDEYAFILRYQLGKLAVRMNRQKLDAALDRSASEALPETVKPQPTDLAASRDGP